MLVVAVELPGGAADEPAQQLGVGVQLGERELDPLVDRQRLAPGVALAGVGDGLVDAVLGGADARRGLADAALVDEALGDGEALADLAEDRVVGDAHARDRHLGVVGRHVEGPPVVVDLEAGRVGRDEEGGDPARLAGLARGAGEDEVVGGEVHPGVEALGAVDHPVAAVAAGASSPGGRRRSRGSGSVSPNATR